METKEQILQSKQIVSQEKRRIMKHRKLLCQMGPVGYWLSLHKEYLLRDIKNLLSREHFATKIDPTPLPCLVKGHTSLLLRRLHGVDMRLQEGKAVNLRIAAARINGIVIQPGETFSFWKLVGKATRKEGYTEGLMISSGGFRSGVGGGLCQLANMVHWLVLNSPLTVTELHHHSDALFPDERRTVPFGTGTSVFYKNVDYQFRNTTDQPVQLLLWLDDTDLCGELRAQRPFPFRYRLVETGHRFVKEGEDYYRCSQVWRVTLDRATGAELGRELVLDNHSKVLYDHALIPQEEIAAV